MPYSLTVPLDAAGARFPPNCSRALHATLFTWLERGDPSVARAVHRDIEPKPFTLSPLQQQDEGLVVFRLTLLHDDLWPVLLSGVEIVEVVDVAGTVVPVVQSRVEIVHKTYEALITEARHDTHLSLCFLSPTSFRTGPMHYPLPDPHAVFQSYLNRWNAFAPSSLQITVGLSDVVDAHVALARHHIQTELVDFGRGRLVGFVGDVNFQVLQPRRLGGDILGTLNALTDYAYFCGTGHKTTMGMGQTRRVVAGRRGP